LLARGALVPASVPCGMDVGQSARYSSSVKIRVVVLFGRSRRRWEDNIEVELQEVGYRGVDWIELAQDRDRWRGLVNVVMNVRVTKNSGNYLTS